MVKKSNTKFCQNADEFFNTCNLNSIPVSIVSADIGDIIEEMLLQNINITFHNIKIISNFMKFDDKNNFTNFHRNNLVHVFNKNEALVSDKNHLKLIDSKTIILLFRDSEGKIQQVI